MHDTIHFFLLFYIMAVIVIDTDDTPAIKKSHRYCYKIQIFLKIKISYTDMKEKQQLLRYSQ